MNYIKTFENFEPTKDKGFQLLSNHTKGQEILELLEDKLGTIENPLNVYNNKESNYYGRDKDNIMFRHFDYQEPENSQYWVRHDGLWTVFESKFNLKYDDIQSIIHWYISTTYNLSATYTEKTFGKRPFD